MTTKRIAMWSGPRNLSTAMMYSFGARPDCKVVDEPFYAAYLHATGVEHPMQAEILAAQTIDGNAVAKTLVSPLSEPVFYQKHMAHHMVDGVPRDWMKQVANVFLIRHPARVLASYAQKREGPSLSDIGFVQQAALFDQADAPVVIDSADIRKNPEGMLRALCDAIGIEWDAGMLKWPAGGHADDGVWALHWYNAVHRSTGFAGAEGPLPDLPPEYQDIADAAMPYYTRMAEKKLRI